MKRILPAVLLTAIGLTACGGSHDTMSTVPQAKAKVPQAHVRHLKNGSTYPANAAKKTPLDISGGGPRGLLMDLAILLFDAPLIGATASNAQFNAGILGIDAIDENGDSWQLIANSSPQVVNLLTLQASSLNLGTGSLPPGTYPSLQLLLDPSTTSVVYNGATYPVEITDPNHPWWDPTQTIEAVSIPLNITGNGGDTVTASLDFNVFQSANLLNGIAYVTPTVAGGIGSPSISGSVVNSSGSAVANATIIVTDSQGNVANTSVTAADGTFMVHGISAGSYTLSVANTFTTNAGVTVMATSADAGAAPSMPVTVGPNGVSLNQITD